MVVIAVREFAPASRSFSWKLFSLCAGVDNFLLVYLHVLSQLVSMILMTLYTYYGRFGPLQCPDHSILDGSAHNGIHY